MPVRRTYSSYYGVREEVWHNMSETYGPGTETPRERMSRSERCTLQISTFNPGRTITYTKANGDKVSMRNGRIIR